MSVVSEEVVCEEMALKYGRLMEHVQRMHRDSIVRANQIVCEAITELSKAYAAELAKILPMLEEDSP